MVTDRLEYFGGTARRTVGRAVSSLMTACYWEIGRRIVEHEQKGRHAGDGERLIDQLAPDLTVRFGRSGVAH
jgi:hypothetical protein